MCKLRQVHAILLAKQLLLVFSQPAIVELQRLVVGGSDAEFARIVKVERGYFGIGVCVLEGF